MELMIWSSTSFITVTDVQQAECRKKLRRAAAAAPDGLRMEVFMVNEFVCIRASCFSVCFMWFCL